MTDHDPEMDKELFDISMRIGALVERHKRIAGSFVSSFMTTSLWSLSMETLRRIETSLNKEYASHIVRLIDITDDTYKSDDEIVIEYLNLMPKLSEDQRLVACNYFRTLRRWHNGSALCLDLMGVFGKQYLEVTGTKRLPCTTEEDQKLFELVEANPALRDALSLRVNYTHEITPELIEELMQTHRALIGGAL